VARIPYPDRPADAVARLAVALNAFRMLSHAPDLTGPVIDLGFAVLGQTQLPTVIRELVVMAVAARTRCRYESVQHTPIALAAGVTPEQLAVIGELRPCAPPEFTEAEAAALSAAASITVERTLEPGELDVLRRHFTDRETVEIIMTAGYYAMLAGLMNALDVDVDPSGERFLDVASVQDDGPDPRTS
jgi:AhpD family alkylhydroperoxidase